VAVSVELKGIIKRFGDFVALDGIDLSIAGGEFVALLGPSGSGKTTLLRIIAGLEYPDKGRLVIGGEDAAARSARDRGIGLVFQHYALFRHMSVFENIAFGLRVRPAAVRQSKKEIHERVARLLDLVQLEQFANRYPSQLSGGQRQRVALARALAIEPRLLLLDEPFGALDAKVRKELRRWLRRLHDEMGLTSLFVTHDQQEALELADRVVVMDQGQIQQIGHPDDVYADPATPFVYDFIGHANRFEGMVKGGKLSLDGVVIDCPTADASDGKVWVYVRPHHITLSPVGTSGTITAQILQRLPAGSVHRLEVSSPVAPSAVEIDLPLTTDLPEGMGPGMPIGLKLTRFKLFPIKPSG
jgi:sulfate/thiosulfate transport system ATP-binding protein